MSNSHLVWAERFELKELTSASNGTYNKEGRKVLISAKLVSRSFAESRNINDNNELYVFDEEKTKELDAKREAYKLEQSNIKVESSEDKLAAAMVKALGGIGGAKPEPVKEEKEVDTLEDLKTIIKDNDLGIRVTKTDTREKVEAKIKESQKK
tara:strand:+ start:1475 stop:1933 length:459 start_codon:yes stop_codon:yes gene_type:complete